MSRLAAPEVRVENSAPQHAKIAPYLVRAADRVVYFGAYDKACVHAQRRAGPGGVVQDLTRDRSLVAAPSEEIRPGRDGAWYRLALANVQRIHATDPHTGLPVWRQVERVASRLVEMFPDATREEVEVALFHRAFESGRWSVGRLRALGIPTRVIDTVQTMVNNPGIDNRVRRALDSLRVKAPAERDAP